MGHNFIPYATHMSMISSTLASTSSSAKPVAFIISNAFAREYRALGDRGTDSNRRRSSSAAASGSAAILSSNESNWLRMGQSSALVKEDLR